MGDPEVGIMLQPACSAKRVVCVGDLHGNLEQARSLWQQLERKLGKDELFKETAVVFLGDFCDRGPNTSALLDWLIALQNGHPRIFFLSGNHDFGMASFLGCIPHGQAALDNDLTLESTRKPNWISGFWPHEVPGGMHYQGRRWGGSPIYNAESTFQSYGVALHDWEDIKHRDALIAAVPDTHKRFLAGLRWVVELQCVGDATSDPLQIVCVHAGLSGQRDVAAQLEALRARDWRSPVLHEKGDPARIEAFTGRSSVLRNPLQLKCTGAVLVSGHHGMLVMDQENLRAVIDANGGHPDKPVQAAVFPDWALASSSDGISE